MTKYKEPTPVPCKFCMKLIIWVKMEKSDKLMPIDYMDIHQKVVLDGSKTRGAIRYVGTSHFETCANPRGLKPINTPKEKHTCHKCGCKNTEKYLHKEVLGGLITQYTCFTCRPRGYYFTRGKK